MKIMHCPLNGPRNISEFAYGGEVRSRPDEQAGPEAWSAYLYIRDNQPRVVREWWMHVPTSYWFISERDLARDEIVRTYAATELQSGEPA